MKHQVLEGNGAVPDGKYFLTQNYTQYNYQSNQTTNSFLGKLYLSQLLKTVHPQNKGVNQDKEKNMEHRKTEIQHTKGVKVFLGMMWRGEQKLE